MAITRRDIGVLSDAASLDGVEGKQITDTERLNFILLKGGEDYRFQMWEVLGDYDGDDDDQYLQAARDAIDQVMSQQNS